VVEPLVLLLMGAAGLATGLGALPVVAARGMSHRTHDTILGFAAGMMLGISALGLLPHSSSHLEDGGLLAASVLAGGVAIFVLVWAVRRLPLPMPFVRNGAGLAPGGAFLVFLALAIHNAPEGLATGVGYSEGLTPLGHAIALGIAIQNIPEGLLVSIAVLRETGSRRAAAGYALLSGAVEPVAGFLALLWLSLSPRDLGLASGFAVGAMWSVISFQMIPESHRHGHRRPATLALLLGLGLAAILTVLFGNVGT
jgi:ZIP family zinc transporter